MHPQSIIAAVLTIWFTVFALKLIADAQDAAREKQIFGDVPLVPMELRLPGKKAGGAAEHGRGAGTFDVRTHRDGSL